MIAAGERAFFRNMHKLGGIDDFDGKAVPVLAEAIFRAMSAARDGKSLDAPKHN